MSNIGGFALVYMLIFSVAIFNNDLIQAIIMSAVALLFMTVIAWLFGMFD